jgi:hypothetical protein
LLNVLLQIANKLGLSNKQNKKINIMYTDDGIQTWINKATLTPIKTENKIWQGDS